MASDFTTRIRHENARRRTLTVRDKQFVTANFLSIRFACEDLSDFASASWDDHIKLILEGDSAGESKPPMRDYTPRSFHKDRGEFVIEFALHEDPGPATLWARNCAVGETVEMGGPRGSVAISNTLDWYWLIGDETAIPAISRCMDEQPGSLIKAIIVVTGPAEEINLPLSPLHSVTWAHRPAEAASDPRELLSSLRGHLLPAGKGFVWIAAETSVAKAARETILEMGHPLSQLKARGYWSAGKANKTAAFE